MKKQSRPRFDRGTNGSSKPRVEYLPLATPLLHCTPVCQAPRVASMLSTLARQILPTVA